VIFELTAGAERDEFVAAAGAVTDWASRQPGFVDRELYEVGGGRWIDTVRWSTIDDATAAASAIGTASDVGDFTSMIHGPSVQMMHGHPVSVRG
jgi:hypothetical protein